MLLFTMWFYFVNFKGETHFSLAESSELGFSILWSFGAARTLI